MKNLFMMSLHSLKSSGTIPPAIIKQANQFKLYLQTEIISSYLLANGGSSDMFNNSSVDNEFLVVGDELNRNSPQNRRNQSFSQNATQSLNDSNESKDRSKYGTKLNQKRLSSDVNNNGTMPPFKKYYVQDQF